MEDNEIEKLNKIITDLENKKADPKLIFQLKYLANYNRSKDERKIAALEKIAEELTSIRRNGVGQERGS